MTLRHFLATLLAVTTVAGTVLLVRHQVATPPQASAPPQPPSEMVEQQAENAARDIAISQGLLKDWLRRTDLEQKTFKDVLTKIGGSLENVQVYAEPPTKIRSLTSPFQRGDSTTWITLGMNHAYLPAYRAEFLEYLNDFPVQWAVETPHEPSLSEKEGFPIWIEKLNQRQQTAREP